MTTVEQPLVLKNSFRDSLEAESEVNPSKTLTHAMSYCFAQTRKALTFKETEDYYNAWHTLFNAFSVLGRIT